MIKKTVQLTDKLLFVRKLPWIDIVGVAIFFFIVAMAAFFFLRKANNVTITLRVSQSGSLDVSSSPPLWYVAQLHQGLAEKDGLGRNVLTIEDVSNYLNSTGGRV